MDFYIHEVKKLRKLLKSWKIDLRPHSLTFLTSLPSFTKTQGYTK
jgi:hypothetical protein